MRDMFIKTLIAIFGIGAVYCICMILFEWEFDDTRLKVIESLGTVFLFCIPGLICARIERTHSTVAKLGIGACVIACIFILLLRWEVITLELVGIDGAEFLTKLFSTLLIVTFSTTHISILLGAESKDKGVDIVKNITIALSLVLDVMLVFMILFETKDIDEKLYMVLAILVAAGTIITVLLNRLNEGAKPLPTVESKPVVTPIVKQEPVEQPVEEEKPVEKPEDINFDNMM